MVDLGRLLDLHQQWRASLPSVEPFYAVKCNDDPALLKTLAGLGTGFDCASKVSSSGMLNRVSYREGGGALGSPPPRIMMS